MPRRGKAEILKAATDLVAAQKASLAIGGLRDMTVTDRDSPGEETQEDELALLDQPSPLSTRGSDVLSPDG